MLANFLGLSSKTAVCKFTERKPSSSCLDVLHKNTKLGSSDFVVVPTAKKCTKKRGACAKLLFCLYYTYCFPLFWLPSPSSSLKLPIIMVKLSRVTAANSSSMIVYFLMDKWLDHKLNFLRHFSLNFPLPDRIKKKRMDSLVWPFKIRLDDCFSFTWSHSLKVCYVTHLRRVFLEL